MPHINAIQAGFVDVAAVTVAASVVAAAIAVVVALVFIEQ